jgi:hypothetical protein
VKHTIFVGACLLALVPGGVSAQGIDVGTEPKFIFGPLGLTPRLALKDIGVDSNPLNESGGTERDFTATFVPGVDSTLRIGRGRLTAKTAVEYVYYNKSSSQRSFNFNQELRADVLLNRLAPFATGGYLRTRQRANLEIDERVQRTSIFAGAGTALRLSARTNLELEGRRTQFRFGNGQYGDEDISEALDRDSDVYSVTTRHALTPLTTFVVRGETTQDRFVFASVRDSDSISVVPGFEFKPSALLAGKVNVGYRRFDAIDATVPDFSGLVGDLDFSYTWREQTKFGFRAGRNVEYSIEDEQPYFVTNGGGLEITQAIGLNWFAVARGGRQRLVYRNFVETDTTAAADIGRSDRVDSYGGGFGRRLSTDIRVQLDVNKVRRLSSVATRQYEGYRVGVTITYGS